MFDFSIFRDPVWPEHLKPEGEGSFEKEGFEPWWARHKEEIGHLHPKIAEQWIHRHWFNSEFSFLPLNTMRWELVPMDGSEILSSVKRELAQQLDPEFDYESFQGRYGDDKLQTAKALDTGTWDYPIVALSTPSGWRSLKGEFPSERLMLIEGHQRHRYLNALHYLNKAPNGPHDVFIVSSPMAD